MSQPVIFCCHGGGPLPLMGQQPDYLEHFNSLQSHLPSKPAAILVVSAHWEEDAPTVMMKESNSLLFDYSGFPEETYTYKYHAKGSPAVARRVQELLSQHGLHCGAEVHRGLDHGVFVPLMPAFPDASIPVLQLSLVRGLDAALHIKIGEALRPLREEKVLLLGSGLSFHNMQAFMSAMGGRSSPDVARKAREFDTHLTDVCTNTAHRACPANPSDPPRAQACSTLRQQLLMDWKRFPHAQFCHPREEHLAPLFVCVGAAGTDAGKQIFSATGSIAASSYQFG